MDPSKNRQERLQKSRGVALITTLLLLSLFTVMTLAMVIATTSDTLINGYYRNARGSFYAADSGMNAARQYLINQIYASLPTSYVPSSGSPVLTSTSTILANLVGTSPAYTSGVFSSYQSSLGSQTASWPESFKINGAGSSLSMTCTPLPQCSNGSTTAITGNPTYTYTYIYHLVSQGESQTSGSTSVEEWGNIVFDINMNPSTSTVVSFSDFGTLLDQYALCSAPFVPGTMSGQMFSNQSWNFGNASALGSSTGYIFTGNVGLAGTQVGYMYGGGFGGDSCNAVGNNGASNNYGQSNTSNGSTIAPKFEGGLTFGASVVPMPTDSYNQMTAVLDGLGDCPPAPAACSAPSLTQLAVLTNAAGKSYVQSGVAATTGVFLPYTITTVGGVTTKTLNSGAGGIYVQGSATQLMLSTATPTISGAPHTEQIIQVWQGTLETTVTLDLTGQTTQISDSSGNNSGVLTGLPQNLNFTPSSEACLVYVAGNVSSNTSSSTPTGFSGPSSGAAIANGSAITVVSTGVIDVTGSLTYSTEPVSLTTADTPVSPVPTNVLGIYTSGGNLELKPSSSTNTLEIDAAIATMASGQNYGIIGQWNNINTVAIVGGRVQNEALSGASIGQRNIYFDQRFSTGFAPPWFPTTTITTSNGNTASPQMPIAQRMSWLDTSNQ